MENSLFESKTQPTQTAKPTQNQQSSQSIFTPNMLFWSGLFIVVLIIFFIVFTQWKKNCSDECDDGDGFIVKPVRDDTSGDFDVESQVAKIKQKQEDYLNNRNNTTSGEVY